MAGLFGISFGSLGYILLKALRDAEESYASDYTSDTARQFEDLFLFIPAGRMLQISRITAVVIFVLLFFALGDLNSMHGIVRGGVAGCVGGIATLFMPRAILSVLRRRRLERFNKQLVDALTSMSNALKAGFSIQQAFETIVQERQNPISQEFAMFLQQIRVGMKFEDAMTDLDRRVGSEDLTLMILSIETARQTGGNLTEVFDRIAETIRERMRIEGKIKSLTAQGKIQGRVVGAMPVFLGIAMYMLDKQMMLTFIKSQVGIIVLAFVVIMEVFGALMIKKIVTIDV
ncbi:MAG: type II secretion system F family protein [Kiritimatiellales bacterium]|nr:type II secretion system F family protein [Kiritimatiellales bacterium]